MSEWPNDIEIEKGKLGKWSWFAIFKWDKQFNEIANAFIDKVTNGKRDKPSLLKFWSSVVNQDQ